VNDVAYPLLFQQKEGVRHMLQYHNLTVFKTFRKELRNTATDTERELWEAIKGNKLGYKFRRQHSYEKYVFDFYCPAVRLAIEIDGSIHDERSSQVWDQDRTAFLNAHSIDVLRFSNEEVFSQLSAVIQKILKSIKEKKNQNTPSCG